MQIAPHAKLHAARPERTGHMDGNGMSCWFEASTLAELLDDATDASSLECCLLKLGCTGSMPLSSSMMTMGSSMSKTSLSSLSPTVKGKGDALLVEKDRLKPAGNDGEPATESGRLRGNLYCSSRNMERRRYTKESMTRGVGETINWKPRRWRRRGEL